VVVAANGREADAKSLMSVLALGAKGGSTLTLRAEGEEASGAVQALADCIAGLVE
jgi:phosphotransferase system HPr (HPr) family protein